ncbi:MAG: type IV secretion system DNA-binding domain-containing protein [Candidatus Nomurabacteria bacterium]|nr:type IV secretion system DNA-binding domain-containing protein [Candidatus Nomurabacteria bacterium]
MEDIVIPENKDMTYLGQTTFRNKNVLFGIKRKDRRQHCYLLGKSGTGKSALMTNMVLQNIINGDGVCVVDPHGELVESIVSAIPAHRLKDVIYFNPADTDYHIGFNVLELLDPRYKHLVASGLMGIFTKIWANAWSARMEYILNNCILALLDTPGTTLLGIPRMLVDKDYRQKIITNLKDPVIKAFWIHEYEAWQDKFRNEAIAPIQNKVGQFLSTSIIRNVVGQSKSTIDLFQVMNEGKIFLVNVSKGRIGEDNSALLGGMLITKIQLAAMERVRIPEEERKDFYLYVDEFQNFVTDAFASILSEARKYRLNLTIAHQYTAQLVTANGSAVRDAVFGNVGTMIIFRVGADDAEFLEKEFEPEFMATDIVNLPNYRIYLKLMIDGITSRPFSAKTLAPMNKNSKVNTEEEVIKSSRTLYGRSKEVVESEINSWSGMSLGDIVPPGGNAGADVEKFPVICSNCMKETTVPFKPEEGRAVYCKECIAKMKTGELKPTKGSARQIKYDEETFFKPLADLGIEFTSKEAPPKVIPKPYMPPVSKPGIFGTVKKVFQNTVGAKPPSPISNIPKPISPITTTNVNVPVPPKPPINIFKPPTPSLNIPTPVIPTPTPPVKPIISTTPIESQKPQTVVEKPKENTALKDLLNKALAPKPITPVVPPIQPVVPEIKKVEPEPISLASLKNPTIATPISQNKDRSASAENMNKLKEFVAKIAEPLKAEEIKKEEQIPTQPPVTPAPTPTIQKTTKEVPEDVLRKILEE